MGQSIAENVPRETLNRLSSLKSLIGNTPLLAVKFAFRGTVRTLYAKAEYLKLTGSIKGRMALHLLESGYKDGGLRPGDTIVEATSGNTGIALAAIGRALGHPVVIYMPDWMSCERVRLIESYGAKVVPVSRDRGGFLGSISLTEEPAEHEDHVFLPRQFAKLERFVFPPNCHPEERTWISHFAMLARTTCAALLKESRMEFIKATGLNGKSGVAQWRDLLFSQP